MSLKWETSTWEKASMEYNRGEFFECHETLEEWWLYADEPIKTFLQGIIQISAAMIKQREDNFRGATQLLTRALPKLTQAQSQGLLIYSPLDKSRLEDFQGKIVFILNCLECQQPEKLPVLYPKIDF